MSSRCPKACLRAGMAAALPVLLAACGDGDRREAMALTGGDPERGRAAIRAHGCPACHSIPGVAGADAQVGPPLRGIAKRVVIAGSLPNTPEHMVRWLMDPPAVNPGTLMPNLNLGESEARDIAGYLYTLRD